jgi:hypothetical protein
VLSGPATGPHGRKGKPGGARPRIGLWSTRLKGKEKRVFLFLILVSSSVQIQTISKQIQKLEHSTIQKKLHGSMNSTSFWFDLAIYRKVLNSSQI